MIIHSPAETFHQQADVSFGHSGSRHVHNATVWLGVQRVLGFCGEQISAVGLGNVYHLLIILK